MTAASFEYIEVFYNRTRRHSTLGYQYRCSFWRIGVWLNMRKTW